MDEFKHNDKPDRIAGRLHMHCQLAKCWVYSLNKYACTLDVGRAVHSIALLTNRPARSAVIELVYILNT